MKFLQKILMIAMIVVFAGNANAVDVFDIPDAPMLYETRVFTSEGYPAGGLIEVALNGLFIEKYSKQVVIREKRRHFMSQDTMSHMSKYIYIFLKTGISQQPLKQCGTHAQMSTTEKILLSQSGI
jgi:hypothetical protein